jgi:ribulose-phosphate 3-epimerase|tara:strand:- start:669 stop:1328 length:660 start_codon:yes stop_codon:yes gene_type:complete
MNSIKISPSILSADLSKLGSEIQNLEKAKADLIHIDVMDGHFVPNITIGPEVINKLKKYTSLPFDVHLMISPVHNFIKNFADAGADIITIHPEATNDLESSIKKIKLYNKKVGISLNPETSLDKLNNVLDKIDLVLIMSVNPGFGGQKFIENTLNKIKKLRLKIDQLKLKVEIEVDGGINFENSKSIIKAGADILVSGTTIFKSNGGNIKKNIEILKNQ